MTLARMSDPPRSAGKDNLSFKRLEAVVEEQYPGSISSSCSQLVEAFVSECEPLRDLRNRQLAHADLRVALGENDEPLPGVSRKTIRSVIDRAAEILNQLAGDILDSHTLFSETDPMFTGEGLIKALSLAREVRLKQLSERRSGL
jgi:hypothetical protein